MFPGRVRGLHEATGAAGTGWLLGGGSSSIAATAGERRLRKDGDKPWGIVLKTHMEGTSGPEGAQKIPLRSGGGPSRGLGHPAEVRGRDASHGQLCPHYHPRGNARTWSCASRVTEIKVG